MPNYSSNRTASLYAENCAIKRCACNRMLLQLSASAVLLPNKTAVILARFSVERLQFQAARAGCLFGTSITPHRIHCVYYKVATPLDAEWIPDTNNNGLRIDTHYIYTHTQPLDLNRTTSERTRDPNSPHHHHHHQPHSINAINPHDGILY